MFCIKCGSQLPDGMAFCTQCGAPQPKKEIAESQISAPEAVVSESAVTQLISTYEPEAEPVAQSPDEAKEDFETIVLDAVDSDAVEQSVAAPAVAAAVAEPAAAAPVAEPVVPAAVPAAAAPAAEPVAPYASALPDSAFEPLTPEPVTQQQPAPQPSAFCMKCGATLPAGLSFCTQCGTPVGTAGVQAPVASPAAVPSGAMASVGNPPQGYGQTNPFENPYERKPKRGKGPIIALVTLLAVAAIAAGVVFFVLPQFGIDVLNQATSSASSDSSKSSGNAADSTIGATDSAKANASKVTFAFTGKNYDSKKSTPVPVRITGKSDEGDSVDEVVYATDGSSFDIALGTYTATIDASPLTDDGLLYNVSSYKVKFVVDDKGATLTFDIGEYAIEPADITDNQISAASAAAKEAGVSASDIESKVAATQKARDDAVAAKKKAEEEKKAADEKASKTYYVCASDFVTLRSSASTSASAITRINSREAVTMIDDQGTWAYVEYNGNKGYVLTRFISKDPNAPLDYGDV